LLKRRAELCSPKIRPYKTRDGYEYYVLFAGASIPGLGQMDIRRKTFGSS
jgi:hypothetical protein